MKNKNDFLANFIDKDEKFDASKIYDAYIFSIKTGKQVFTDFITPVLLSNLLTAFERQLNIYDVMTIGGHIASERQCIVFNYCDYAESEIKVLKISTNIKFNKPLEHRAVLGSVLGLGITRNKVGDILFKNGECYLFIKSEIADFILYNLEYIGRNKVKLEEVEDFVEDDEKTNEIKTTTVSSLRVDVIISNVTKYSRSEVKKLFEKELVFINWKICKNSSVIVKENDVITVRKFGRVRLENIKGTSKKGKIIIDYSRN